MNYDERKITPDDRQLPDDFDLEHFDVFEIPLDCHFKDCNNEPTHYDKQNDIFTCEGCIRVEITSQS